MVECKVNPGPSIAVFPEPPLLFSHELLAGLRAGFWWLPLSELHVHSPTGGEAEAQSEYGVGTEYFICLFLYAATLLQGAPPPSPSPHPSGVCGTESPPENDLASD
jgi:hypothetical protein